MVQYTSRVIFTLGLKSLVRKQKTIKNKFVTGINISISKPQTTAIDHYLTGNLSYYLPEENLKPSTGGRNQGGCTPGTLHVMTYLEGEVANKGCPG